MFSYNDTTRSVSFMAVSTADRGRAQSISCIFLLKSTVWSKQTIYIFFGFHFILDQTQGLIFPKAPVSLSHKP